MFPRSGIGAWSKCFHGLNLNGLLNTWFLNTWFLFLVLLSFTLGPYTWFLFWLSFTSGPCSLNSWVSIHSLNTFQRWCDRSWSSTSHMAPSIATSRISFWRIHVVVLTFYARIFLFLFLKTQISLILHTLTCLNARTRLNTLNTNLILILNKRMVGWRHHSSLVCIFSLTCAWWHLFLMDSTN